MESKHKFADIRVPIEEDNVSIKRIEDKCRQCGLCAIVCREKMSVYGSYSLCQTNDRAICVGCGQCVNACPFGAIEERSELENVLSALKDNSKIVTFSIAPAVRVAFGEEFGLPLGTNVERKLVSLCKSLGAKYVFDVTFGADLTIMEEASELLERLKTNTNLPMITSCCPAWVKFAEIFFPQNLSNLSTSKSPIAMQGSVIKSYFAKVYDINPKNIVNVVITPCTAKKMEIRRQELSQNGIQNMDFCLTTRELATLAKQKNIDIETLKDEQFDELLSRGSGAGVIFGATGGVMEAALRTSYYLQTNTNPPKDWIEYSELHTLSDIKTAEIQLGEKNIKVCVVNGLKNARDLLEKINKGEVYFDFIEVMACIGGCSGGGGQPKTTIHSQQEVFSKRVQCLLDADKNDDVRFCHENLDIISLYKNFLTKPLSESAEKLLHTNYKDCSEILKGK